MSVAPRSSGAIVVDEAAPNDVSVYFNFFDNNYNNTRGALGPVPGHTGTGGEFYTAQSDVFSNPPPANLVWRGPERDGGGTLMPETNGVASTLSNTNHYVVWSQPRGTNKAYYSKRRNNTTGSEFIGVPIPVGERVPNIPILNRVDSSNNGQTHTVFADIPVENPAITTLYYRQTTSTSVPAYDDRNDNNNLPPSGWQTSTSFSANIGTTYYYWALGWSHSNPGFDGAAISGFIAKIAATDSYGIKVETTSGNYLIDSDKGLSTSNCPRTLVATAAGAVSGGVVTNSSAATLTGSGYSSGDILWVRSGTNADGTAAAATINSSGGGFVSNPIFYSSSNYIIQKDVNGIATNTAFDINGSDYGIQVKNAAGVVAFDSRKMLGGIEIIQISPPGSFAGGQTFKNQSGTVVNATNNLIYTASSSAEFNKLYVTTGGSAFTGSWNGSFYTTTALIAGFFFDNANYKIYWTSWISAGPFGTIPYGNAGQVFIGKRLT